MTRRARREILFTIDRNSDVPLYRQLYEQARDAIIQGVVEEGDRLPSIRRLSRELQISHTTIEQAYLQLSVEGYVTNMPRSGYIVAHFDAAFLRTERLSNKLKVLQSEQHRDRRAFFAENSRGSVARYDFSYANLPADSFPVKTWRQLMNDVLYANTAPEFARYTYTDRVNDLSRQLSLYLGQARGVDCTPEQVILQPGSDNALATLLTLFDREQHIVGIEEPGWATVREVSQRMDFKMVGIPVDQGSEAFMDALRAQKPKIVFTTPSHQFPTGAVMQLETRIELLKWACETNAYIVEDDSCNEYRYNTSPIPSLQSLDTHYRVVYLCNASKVLSPSMRLAYLVLPPKLLGRYYRLYNGSHPGISLLEQELMTRFIREGHWEQHIRRMAKRMHRRHDLLLESLEKEMGGHLTVEGMHSGMHLYVGVENGMSQDELLQSAFKEGAAVYSAKRLWFTHPGREEKVLIGFSSIPSEDIPDGVAALRRAWFPTKQ